MKQTLLAILLLLCGSVADAQAIRPPHATVERNPRVVFTVYVHPSCNQVRIRSPYAFTDCLGAALSNYGRVCGVAFRIVPNAPADFRFWSMPNTSMRNQAMGDAGYPDGWIAISQTAFDGRTRTGEWSPVGLISVLQHEIGHKPQFGHLGWPTHSPAGVACCMNPWSPLLARYPRTNEGVAQFGLAGFSRREADVLATRYGIRWLYWVE